MVAEAIKKDIETVEKELDNEGNDSDGNLPFVDDEDEDRDYLNSNMAYEEWKMRELKRIKRDRDEKQAREFELKEIERRRNMSDLERDEENKRLGSDHYNKKQNVAYNFMQKFYHKGAFF